MRDEGAQAAGAAMNDATRMSAELTAEGLLTPPMGGDADERGGVNRAGAKPRSIRM